WRRDVDQGSSVLVSHWYVDSDASMFLIEGVFRHIARDAKLARGDAQRLSISDFVRRPEPEVVHPAYWAPFVVVGREDNEHSTDVFACQLHTNVRLWIGLCARSLWKVCRDV